MLQEDAADLGYVQAVPDLEKIQIAGRHLLGADQRHSRSLQDRSRQDELCVEQFDVATLITDVVGTAQPLVAEASQSAASWNCPPTSAAMHADPTQAAAGAAQSAVATPRSSPSADASPSRRRARDARTEAVDRIPRRGHRHRHDRRAGVAAVRGLHAGRYIDHAQATAARASASRSAQRFCRMMGGDITVESEPGARLDVHRQPARGRADSRKPTSTRPGARLHEERRQSRSPAETEYHEADPDRRRQRDESRRAVAPARPARLRRAARDRRSARPGDGADARRRI